MELQVKHETCTWTVNLGLAIADGEANLFLAVGVTALWRKIIFLSVMIQLFNVLKGAVHSPSESPIST